MSKTMAKCAEENMDSEMLGFSSLYPVVSWV